MVSVKKWLSEKVFRCVHGRNLVYNICWEDPRLDKVALELGPSDNLLVITSAGCNALSYALTGLNHVYAVDMNYRQNALLELKMAAIRELDYEHFFQLFGAGRYPGIKQVYRSKLRDHLCEQSQMFWDKKIRRYFDSRRKSFYFCGTSGYFAKQINTYVDYYARIRKPVMELLNCQTPEEQEDIWFNKIRKRFWTRLLSFFMRRDATLALLGVPPAQRLQIEKTYPGGLIKYIQDNLDTVFGHLPISDNYFWRVYTTGSYTKECCPEYLEESNFEALKGGLVDRISVYTATVEGFLREHPENKISRFVLLDHMDWLSDQLYDALVSEWDAIIKSAAPKTKIIWRSGGLRTDYVDTVPVKVDGVEHKLGDLLEYHAPLAAELHAKDRVHTYGSFYIADLKVPQARQ